MNPVYDPFPYADAATFTADKKATIWGRHDTQFTYFMKINGEKLPSRNGAGVPLSLELAPGNYTIDIFYVNPSMAGDADLTIDAMVEAGHTYKVDVSVNQATRKASATLLDLGTSTKCSFQQYNKVNGAANLVCN
jgi:hypothetical protein